MLTGPLGLAALMLATQTSPSPACGVPGLGDARATFELVDANGPTHPASRLRIEGASVLLRFRGQVIAIPCAELQRHERPADRRWDGALIGFGAGLGVAALIAVGGARASLLSDSPEPQHDHSLEVGIAIVAGSTAIGYWIDSLHGGKRTVFVGKVPGVASPASGLTLAVTGHGHQRALNVGYRVRF